MTGDTHPEFGPGSLADFGPRLLAFVVDGVILANVLAFIVNGGYHPQGARGLVNYGAFLIIELVFVALAGQTPGMRVFGLIVIPTDGRRRAAPQWVLVRTLLLAVILPALIQDKEGIWWHDKAAGMVMVRTR